MIESSREWLSRSVLFPLKRKTPVWRAVLYTLSLIGFGIWLQTLLLYQLGSILFLIMYPVIFISTWLWGSAIGFFSLLISIVAVDYYFIGPPQTLAVLGSSDFIRLGLFVFNNGIVIMMVHLLRRSETRAMELLSKASESELLYRTSIELSPYVVWHSDAQGLTTYINQTWVDYTGLALEQTKGYGWSSSIHPDDLELVTNNWQQAVSSVQNFEMDMRIRRADGEYRWFHARGRPILATDGKVQRWMGKAVDIHETKLALSLRDNFFSLASHELKTPLTSLKLQMQLLSRQLQRQDIAILNFESLNEMSQLSLRQIYQLNKLIDEMLDVSRITSGKMSYSFVESDAKEIVQSAVETVASHYKEAQISLDVQLSDGIPISADRHKLAQVVINLLTNALKYGAGKPVDLVLSRSEQGPWARIDVIDRGIGIDEHNQDRIFNRFERGVKDTRVSGLGLGLFISREVVEAHKGRISLASIPQQGSRFTVEIPMLDFGRA